MANAQTSRRDEIERLKRKRDRLQKGINQWIAFGESLAQEWEKCVTVIRGVSDGRSQHVPLTPRERAALPF